MRQIKKINNSIRIYHNDDWDEYVVSVKGQPCASYHTDCKEDAINTAMHMATLPVNNDE